MFIEMLKTLTKNGKRDLALSSVFFAFYGLASVGMVIIVFTMLFKIMGGAKAESLYLYFISLVVLVIFKGICNMVADLKKHSVGFLIVGQIRKKMMIRLKQFSLGFYTNERLGEINTVLHKDVDNMAMVIGHVWSRMFGDFLIAIAVFIGLAVFNVKLALIMALPVAIPLGFLYLCINHSKKIENENNSALVDMVNLFVEYVRGIPVLKSFSDNKSLDDDLISRTKRFGETSTKASRSKALELSFFGFLLDLVYFLLLALGGILAFKGNLDPFTYIIFAVISKEFYKPFASIETHYMYYISAIDSYDRLGKILNAKIIEDNKDGDIPRENTISFQNIEFHYEEDEFKIENLSFDIMEHSMTAFVGESGSGKTTITNLLLRFYEVSKGSITIGGVDIREIPYDDLLNKISIVMQNVQLFDNTIEENLRVGKRGATKEELITACKRARIHEYICSLPKGYETKIGEDGGLLSGGQRQRISIARAFLKDAPILILDEMTSNVDPVNESLIQDAITELARNRTVLVVAHHLKTIRQADQILVFKNGGLVEQGKHESLLECQGYYWKLWQAQG